MVLKTLAISCSEIPVNYALYSSCREKEGKRNLAKLSFAKFLQFDTVNGPTFTLIIRFSLFVVGGRGRGSN